MDHRLQPRLRVRERDVPFLDTHFRLLNPDPSPASVRLECFHQNGQVYQQDVTVLGTSMKAVSVADFSAMPNGSFGTRVTVLSGPPIAVERSGYRGAVWPIGYTGVGSPVLAANWHFAEGVTTDTVEYDARDAVGSIRLVFGAQGNVVGRSADRPFGETWGQTGTRPRQWFTGQARDGEATPACSRRH